MHHFKKYFMSEAIEKIIKGEKSISSSALKAAKSSFRDFVHYYEKPKDRKLHFDFGNAIELYLIDKPSFFKEVAILDESQRPVPDKNYQTKENKVWKDNFIAKNDDKLIISSTGKDSFETILKLEALAQKHPYFDMLFGADMQYQDAFEWICPRTGLKRYARTDLYSKEKGIIVDIKSCAEDDFEKEATKFDYVIQAIDQIIGAVESGKMDEVRGYYWFVLTKTEPYFVDVYQFKIEENLRAEESYWSALLQLKSDLQSDWKEIVWHQLDMKVFKLPNWYK